MVAEDTDCVDFLLIEYLFCYDFFQCQSLELVYNIEPTHVELAYANKTWKDNCMPEI